MKGRARLAILRVFLAYFAGAITMLLFLSPGRVRFDDLFNPESRVHLADFDKTADKVEGFCNWILVCLGWDAQGLQGKSRSSPYHEQQGE